MSAATGRSPVGGLWVRHRPPTPEDPAAPRVVLVHGALDRSASFARVARELADLDVVRYDRRGYGRSASADPPRSFDDHVEDLLAVVGDEPTVLVGHSIGALVVLAAAARRPAVARAVVAYEPPTPWAPWWPTPDGPAGGAGDPGDVAEAFLRRMAGDATWEALPPRTRAARRAEGPALVVDLRSARTCPFDPAALGCPVVLAHGGRADEHHRRGVALLADEVPGAQVAVVDGAGHGGHLSHPAAVADLVRRVTG